MVDLYTLWINEEPAGPYTFGQLRSMWAAGQINATTYFREEGEEEWRQLLEICDTLESPPAKPPQLPRSQEDSHTLMQQMQANQTHTIELQSQMKSTGVAALLSLFIPFFGALYSSALAFFIPLLLWVAIFFVLAAQTNATVAQIPQVVIGAAFIPYVISIFMAIGGVSSYNADLIAAAKRG